MNTEKIVRDRVETLYDARFLKLYDIQYEDGRHYYEASRRENADLVSRKDEDSLKKLLPDAVTCGVVLHLPEGQTRLLLSYEYRYPLGQFVLSPVAGLLDPEDLCCDEPLITAAKREIFEETGLTVKDTDEIRVVIPCSFCSPGMTDECTAFVMSEIAVDDLHGLSQAGAVGSELFDGFELVDRAQAEEIYRTCRDKNGRFFSLATWTVIGLFLSGL